MDLPEEIELYFSMLKPATWEKFQAADKYSKPFIVAIEGIDETDILLEIIEMIKISQKTSSLTLETKKRIKAKGIYLYQVDKAVIPYGFLPYAIHHYLLNKNSDIKLKNPVKINQKTIGKLAKELDYNFPKYFVENFIKKEEEEETITVTLEAQQTKKKKNNSLINSLLGFFK